jgi:hypothetical protein
VECVIGPSILLGYVEDPCGSEPAHESGVSADYIQTEKKLSRAGSLPQGLGKYPFFQFVARNANAL